MGDEQYTTQRTTSSQRYVHSTNQRQAEYATERAKVLFGSYRRGDANDPDAYVASVAAVLSMYDVELIREVTDPRTGIATTEKFMSFMPNAGELKVYCDGVAARRDRIEKLGSLPTPDFTQRRLPKPAPVPGDLATIFVPANNPRYPRLLEWSKTADERKFRFETRPGIWVSYDIWDTRQAVARKMPLAGDAADLLNSRATGAQQPTDAYLEAGE